MSIGGMILSVMNHVVQFMTQDVSVPRELSSVVQKTNLEKYVATAKEILCYRGDDKGRAGGGGGAYGLGSPTFPCGRAWPSTL